MSQHDCVVKVRLADDAFRVTISPNIDFAFIASLIGILHQLQQIQDAHKKQTTASAKAIASGIGKVVVEAAPVVLVKAASEQGTSSTTANNQETQEEDDDDDAE